VKAASTEDYQEGKVLCWDESMGDYSGRTVALTDGSLGEWTVASMVLKSEWMVVSWAAWLVALVDWEHD
jgi:hypothetical protein